MKVNELPKETNLTLVKVQLPTEALAKFQKFCGGESQMWIIGDWMGEFFLSPQPPSSEGKRDLYPKPPDVNVADILGWDVVEIIK